jgi:hypothetical protein
MDDVTKALHLDLAPLLGDTTVFVHLALHGQDGALLSQNFYWRAASDAGYRALDSLAAAHVTVSAREITRKDGARSLEVQLKNTSAVAALNTKLVTVNAADGTEILPAFYSDNYISLLPGEARMVTVDMPGVDAKQALRLKVRGWNVEPASANAGS